MNLTLAQHSKSLLNIIMTVYVAHILLHFVDLLINNKYWTIKYVIFTIICAHRYSYGYTHHLVYLGILFISEKYVVVKVYLMSITKSKFKFKTKSKK